MLFIDSLPNFYIIGAAKAGTTTLFDLLNQHPQVYLPFAKEPMFYSHDDNYAYGLEWYVHTYFKNADRFPTRGEATPHYLYWSEKVAPRIREAHKQGRVRFIAIFRDPVRRAYSWYWNMIKDGLENLSFQQALDCEPERLQTKYNELKWAGSMAYGYLRGSSYATALKPFLKEFSRQDFLFLLQEDLKQDFSTTNQKMFSFLDLETNVVLRPVVSNPATMSRIPLLHIWLRRQSAFREHLKKLIPLQMRYRIKKGLQQINALPIKYPPLAPEFEVDLRQRLAPEVKTLEDLIGRDLSRWLPS